MIDKTSSGDVSPTVQAHLTLPDELDWKGPGPKPASWWAYDKVGVLTKVYRSYEDYCDD